MKNPIQILLLIALLAAVAPAQATIKAIDTYAKGIDRHTASRKNPKVVFADTSDHTGTSKANWRKFASEKALEKHRETSETYSIAYTWAKNGELVASNFTLFSGSGDWAKYVNHYFRPDGTLAKVEVDYRTFHGDFIVEQNLYYSPSGKLIKKTTAYKDLQTGKPKKPEAGYLDDNSELLAGDIYKAVAKLPFARLIKK
jgi:hypothetical protein